MEEMAGDFNAVVKAHLLEHYTEQEGAHQQQLQQQSAQVGMEGMGDGEAAAQAEQWQEDVLLADDYLGPGAEYRV